MTKINGIPTADEFRKSVGRNGLRRKMQRVDVQMNYLISALSSVQVYRSRNSMRAIEEIRKLRKRCITWLEVNRGKKRFEERAIRNLGHSADRRLQVLRNRLLAPTTTALTARRRKVATAARDDQGLAMNGTFEKNIDCNYDVKRCSSNHLSGPAVNGNAKRYFQLFRIQFPATQFQIEDFVQHCLIPDSLDDPGCVLIWARTTQAVGQLQNGVKYCTAQERLNHRLNFMGDGIVMDSGGYLFDTSCMHTNSAGAGWGMFVVNFDKTFYAGPDSVNEFHHSSFLAGSAVYSAGEISVTNGKVVGLTNRTGHYKVEPEELCRSLAILQREARVDLAEVAVTDPFRGNGLWRRGTDVLAADGDFTSTELRIAPPVNRPTSEPTQCRLNVLVLKSPSYFWRYERRLFIWNEARPLISLS